MAAFRSLLVHTLCLLAVARAVTIYNQLPLTAQSTPVSTPTASQTASNSVSAPNASATDTYIGLAAYDPTTWPPPPNPSPAPATQFGLNLVQQANQVNGLSVAAPASFFGISIEMSVVTQVCK